MRVRWVTLLPLLGALVSAAQLEERQNESTDVTSAPPAEPTTTTETTDEDTTSAVTTSDESTTTTDDVPVTTTETTTDGGDEDTTVVVTRTVTGEDNVVTSRTTRTTTIVSTRVNTDTEFETTTVTSRDQPTATSTVYTTSTQVVNAKRDLEPMLRTLPIAELEAVPTTKPAALTVTRIEDYQLEMVKKDAKPAHLMKRDTITETTTVTEGGDGESTVVETATRTVVSIVQRETTITNTVTETDQADASTTVTVTSTIVVTSTAGETGVITQSETPPETTSGAGGGNGDSSNGGGGGGGGGLSTGAKAGIGAGVGAAGLVLLAGLAWICIKRRRNSVKPNHDDLLGPSEVPVGAAAVGGAGGRSPQTSMSHNPSSTGASYAAAPVRAPANTYNTAEGYRGTAMGDGRAGYAKPEPYGAAYAATSPRSNTSPPNRNSTLGSGPDTLPSHSSPSEMDDGADIGMARSTSPAELGHDGGRYRVTNPEAHEMSSPPAGYDNGTSTAPHDTYEMPAQGYRF